MEIKLNKFKLIELSTEKYGEFIFSPQTTVITGKNSSGKSSLIKSITHTVGYVVKNWDPNFDKNKFLFCLDLSIDGRKIELVRYRNKFIFNNKVYEEKEYRMELYRCLNLSFELFVQGEVPIIPTPTDLFMYNYIDQDTSWSGKLFYNNHDNPRRYVTKSKENELNKIYKDYIGIKNYEINILEIEEREIKKKIELLKENKEKLEYTKKELNDKKENIVSIDINDFKYQIKQLEKRLSKIYVEENKIKYNIFSLSQELRNIEVEILDLDRLYNDLKEKEKLTKNFVCQTCSSKLTHEMFLNKYQIGNEINSVFEIYSEMIEKKEKIEKKITKEKNNLDIVKKELEDLETVLLTKKSTITFQDAIESYGSIENSKKIDKLIENIEDEIIKIEKRITEISDSLKLKKKENNEIDTLVKQTFNDKLDEINLIFKRLDLSRYKDKFMDFGIVKETGSTNNLLYTTLYYIYWYILVEYSKGLKLPFILDTIIKTQYDKENKKDLSKLVNDNILKLNNQIIYAYTEEEYIKLENTDEVKKIDLDLQERICNNENTELEKNLIDWIKGKIGEASKKEKQD